MKFFRILFPLLISFIAAACMGFMFVQSYYEKSVLPAKETSILVSKGATIGDIATELEHNGTIKYARLFIEIAKFTKQTNPKYGEYAIAPETAPKEILRKLQAGEVVVRKFTVPEGRSSYDILQILSSLPTVTGNLPKTIEEGSVLPQTYLYQYGDKIEDIVAYTKKEMDKNLAAEWENRQKDLPLKTPQEALILASIVERETGIGRERAKVASVFINRLNKGMRLESDPTAVYGITLGQPLGEKVARKHVQHENPYNTYKIDRLPPTPICAPGLDSIKAVLNPAKTEYFYFVANGRGGHNFAKTLAEHNENVQKYREALKAAQEKEKAN